MPLNTTTSNTAITTMTTTTTAFDGTDGNDTLNGSAADDTLNGLGGNDQLFGFAGNDILHGGAGNDFLNGGLGNDSYLFGRGDGRDIVYMSDVRPVTEVNTLRLKDGVLPSDLAFDMVGTSLLINLIGSSDQFRVDGFFYGNNTTNSANPLQQIVFADGTTWNLAEIQARLYAGSEAADVRTGTYLPEAITGRGGNDLLDGRGGDDTIDGGAGADTLIGGLGTDQLFGGEGDDSVAGDDGNDWLDGGTGDDRLLGAQGEDLLYGGAGNDYLEGGTENDYLDGGDGNDQLDGGDGHDVLDGGAGNDTLTGGFGSDRYIFGKGDGQDTISMGRTLEPGRLGTLLFKDGVLPGDVIVFPAPVGYGGIIVKLKDNADQVTIEGFLSQDDPSSPYNPVQEIRFGDGTVWNLAAIQAALYAGSNDADHLLGTVKGELITGQAGDDWIDGKGGNDTIDGGAGNDVINGGVGNDTYLFGKGDGQDELRAVEDNAAGKINVLQFKAGVAASDVILERNQSTLVITFKGSTDRITVGAFLDGDNMGNAYNPLQQIRFDDGTAWDAATILAKLNLATEGNDTISGTSGADLINGLGGADRLDGKAGNDTIDGGSGNDTVNGGAGDDTFLFGKGDGQDSITVYNGGGIDTLQFKQGVLPDEVQLEASSYSGLVARIKGGTDQLTVEQFMPNLDTSTELNALQQIRFADGTAWDLARIESQLYGGSAGADRLSGTARANTMFGLDGADFLAGNAGNDTIDGGQGNDTIKGGGDSDTYLFGRGDGYDTLMGTYDASVGKVDVLQFKPGIAPADISLESYSGLLSIKIAGGTDQIRVENFLSDDNTANASNPLQEIRFADGTVWNLAKIESLLYAGTSGGEAVSGTFKADIITGQGGADYLGGKGGNDTLDGGTDNDTLWGGLDNDVLLGGAGNDALNGDEGDDTLDGGSGEDSLAGGIGKDVYLFGKGDGQDTISKGLTLEAGRLGTLQFKDGVLPGDIVLTAAAPGNGGVTVALRGTLDQITINGFLSQDDPSLPSNPVQTFKFADGTSWNLAAIEAALYAGSAQADNLAGTVKGELITGQAGDDSIDGKVGDDTIDGGSGNDAILGGLGNDTYLFGKGDGQDVIGATEDKAAAKLNTLQLKAGIVPGDVILTRNLADLVVTFKGSTDKVTVQSFLNGDDFNNAVNPLQQIRFDDGTAWNGAAILAKLLGATEGNDTISGTSGGDLLSGLGGYDELNGLGGNDTLDGGSGGDRLNGGAGNDTYLYGKGDGWDHIRADGGGVDVLQFKPGVLPGDVTLKSTMLNELWVSIAGSDGPVVVDQFFPANDSATVLNALQQIRFADGTSWDMAAVEAKLYAGGAGADDLNGTANANTMFGGNGDDVLRGNAGNDTLEGGLGNDTIKGGAGSDTYVFGKGDGSDTISASQDSTPGKVDTLQFKEGILPSDIVLNSAGQSLVIGIAGTSDKLTVTMFSELETSYRAFMPLQRIAFADGTVWNTAAITTLLHAGTAGADTIFGGGASELLTGQGGADVIDGNGGNDMIRGGAGDDLVSGGAGGDTILFGRGDGKDTIRSGNADSYIDTLKFDAGIIGSDLALSMSGTSLIINISGSSDQITVNDFIRPGTRPNAGSPVDQIAFADGQVWNIARINAELLADSKAADPAAPPSGMAAPEVTAAMVGIDTSGAAPGW